MILSVKLILETAKDRGNLPRCNELSKALTKSIQQGNKHQNSMKNKDCIYSRDVNSDWRKQGKEEILPGQPKAPSLGQGQEQTLCGEP